MGLVLNIPTTVEDVFENAKEAEQDGHTEEKETISGGILNEPSTEKKETDIQGENSKGT